MIKKPTHTHSPISIGKEERELLAYLSQLGNNRFNVKDYSRKTRVPRSTIYDILYKLEKLEFIIKETANASITSKGKTALELFGGVGRSVGKPSLGVSETQNLSTHYHRFKLPIIKKDFTRASLEKLSPTSIKENKIYNLHQFIAYFPDATIIINPKQVLVQISELVSDEVDKSDIESLNIMLSYADMLKEVGIHTEGVILEEGHWARMDSVFSDLLYEKVNNRYFLQLKDGSKFWIDHSKGREDETNSKPLRKRVDEIIESANNTKSTFHEVDSLVGLSHNLLEAQVNEFNLLKETNGNVGWLAREIKSHGPSWFGMATEAKNIRQQISRLTRLISERQKKLGEFL